MDQLKQPKQELDFNEPVKDTRQELDFNKPVKDTRPEMDFDSDKKPMQPKQEEKPLDRYGNPIDKNNLDLYDDEDIYETDEKGFVLLPKKLKKGLEKESKPQAQQKTLPEPSIRNLNDDESKKIYQMYKNGQTREDLMGYLRKKAIQDNEEESYNDMDASDYLESIITPQIDLKSDYLDKLYDYYGGDAEKIVDELGKYNISENPYVLDNMIRNFVAQKQGKGLLPRLNSLSFNKPLKDFQMENVLDRYGGDPRMAALYFNQFNNKDLTDEDVQNSLNEFYKRYEPFDATKSSAYRNQPNEQIRDAFNFLHDNIYENRNFGLGTESELAFKNIDKIEQYINQLKQIKPRNRYERSDLENVLGQLEEMRDKGLKNHNNYSTANNSQELNQELIGKNPNRKDKYGNPLYDDDVFEAGYKAGKKYLDEALKYDTLDQLKRSNVFLSYLEDEIMKGIHDSDNGYENDLDPNYNGTYQDTNEIMGALLGEEVDMKQNQWKNKKYEGYVPERMRYMNPPQSRPFEDLMDYANNKLKYKYNNEDISYSSPLVVDYLRKAASKPTTMVLDKDHNVVMDNRPPERIGKEQEIVDNTIREQEQERPIKREKKATFILGLPASGKSTLSNLIKKIDGAYEIDPDIMKASLMKEPTDVSAVHEESSWLSDAMFDKLKDTGANFIFPKTGKNYKGVERHLKLLKDKGYKIDIIDVDLPMEKTLARNLSRYIELLQKNDPKKPARIVDMQPFLRDENGHLKTFRQAIDSGLVDSYAAYSSDVPFGEKPKLVYKSKNWRNDLGF